MLTSRDGMRQVAGQLARGKVPRRSHPHILAALPDRGIPPTGRVGAVQRGRAARTDPRVGSVRTAAAARAGVSAVS